MIVAATSMTGVGVGVSVAVGVGVGVGVGVLVGSTVGVAVAVGVAVGVSVGVKVGVNVGVGVGRGGNRMMRSVRLSPGVNLYGCRDCNELRKKLTGLPPNSSATGLSTSVKRPLSIGTTSDWYSSILA